MPRPRTCYEEYDLIHQPRETNIVIDRRSKVYQRLLNNSNSDKKIEELGEISLKQIHDVLDT